MSSEMKEILLTVDVEDNFTREELARPSDWDRYETQVVENTDRVISLLRKLGGDATFFVLGKVAQRHPVIVKKIVDAGYEIASHGYAHELTDRLTPGEFREDVRLSLEVIQSISGNPVCGYRARSFSITRRTPWALTILDDLGLVYDSSTTDAEYETMYGAASASAVSFPHRKLREFPISTARVLNKTAALSGGIVFRLMPYYLYRALLKKSFLFTGPPIIYCHVWEFNKDQPQRQVGFLQKLAQGSWTYSTESKIKKLAKSFTFTSIQKYLTAQER